MTDVGGSCRAATVRLLRWMCDVIFLASAGRPGLYLLAPIQFKSTAVYISTVIG